MSRFGRIAFLGLGAMGQCMASRLVGAGREVAVWNRSGVPASVPSLGGRAVARRRDAVDGADLVFSMVRDDEASRALWLAPEEGALAAMRAGAVVIECSTLTPGWVAELSREARGAGLDFIEAPVVGSRPQAEAGGLHFLAGGEAATVERVRPVLASMGSAVHHIGATPAGAYAKLIVNTLFGVQVAALAELLGFAGKARLDVGVLMQALGEMPVLSASAKAAAAGMVAGRFAPMFPVELVSKDLHYALAAAQEVGGPLPLARSASGVFEEGIARGLHEENLTAVAKLYT